MLEYFQERFYMVKGERHRRRAPPHAHPFLLFWEAMKPRAAAAIL